MRVKVSSGSASVNTLAPQVKAGRPGIGKTEQRDEENSGGDENSFERDHGDSQQLFKLRVF